MTSHFGVGSRVFGGVCIDVDDHVNVGVGVQVLDGQEVSDLASASKPDPTPSRSCRIWAWGVSDPDPTLCTGLA